MYSSRVGHPVLTPRRTEFRRCVSTAKDLSSALKMGTTEGVGAVVVEVNFGGGIIEGDGIKRGPRRVPDPREKGFEMARRPWAYHGTEWGMLEGHAVLVTHPRRE